jgi:hypothetical protein
MRDGITLTARRKQYAVLLLSLSHRTDRGYRIIEFRCQIFSLVLFPGHMPDAKK